MKTRFIMDVIYKCGQAEVNNLTTDSTSNL